MKLLLSLFAMLCCSVLVSIAEDTNKNERMKIEIYIATPKYVTIQREGGKSIKEVELKDLLDINKLVANEHGLQANLMFAKSSEQNSWDFNLMFNLLKSTLEKQGCMVYEAKIGTGGTEHIYVYGPHKAAYEARQKQLHELLEKQLKAQEKKSSEFTKEMTFMKLMETKCREYKWKSFEWKIDVERSIKMLEITEEKLDIEPMLIEVKGGNEFIVNKIEFLNLTGVTSRLNEYKNMAHSAGVRPVYAITTGKLSAAEVYPILVKLYESGLVSLSFGKPKREAPLVKPPVNRVPASPHR